MRIVSILSCLALTAGLHAQASYTTYGTSCNGSASGTNACFGGHKNGGTFRNAKQCCFEFALRFTPTRNTLVVGFELFMRTQSASSITLSTALYGSNSSGTPVSPPLRTSSVTVGTPLKFYRSSFRPLILQAGRTYHVAYTGKNGIYFPHIVGGQGHSFHHWRRSPTASWSGPWKNPYWSWRVLCAGQNQPTLSSKGKPGIGRTFSVDLTNAPANAIALLQFGSSKTKLVPHNLLLPIDLSKAGATGCSIQASIDMFFLATSTGTTNGGQVSILIPNDKKFIGVNFYNQWWVFDAKANAFGMTFSNGGHGIIG